MKEEYRERRSLAQIETTIGDIRYAFRTICTRAAGQAKYTRRRLDAAGSGEVTKFRRLKGQASPSTLNLPSKTNESIGSEYPWYNGACTISANITH
jgi:hypothetical protein